MQDEPYEYKCEANDTAEQSEQHQIIHLYITIRIQNRCALMQTAPKYDTEMHERNLENRQHCNNCRTARTLFDRTFKTAHSEIADVCHEQKRSSRQAWIPLPKLAPGQSTPQTSGDQRDRHEHHTYFGRSACEPIKTH